jgi:parallel beta-helix repeat protein
LQLTIHVPGDYPTIQQALDVAMPGGSVIVAPGVYKETIKMKKGVSLIGSGFTDTIIDGQGIGNARGSVVIGEEDSLITGFTIRNANLNHFNNIGAGIDGGTFTFSIYGNWITNCRIGIRTQGSPVIERNVIINNLHLAGIAVSGSGIPTIINNTVVNNDRGVQVSQNSTPDIVNNIIVGNRAGVVNFGGNVLSVKYNDVFGNNVNYDKLDDQTGLNGNISVDPRFVDPVAENYHLLEDSPCINAGDPATALDLDGTVADIGKFTFDPDFIDALSVPIPTLASPSDETIGIPPQNTSEGYSGRTYRLICQAPGPRICGAGICTKK